MFEDRGGAGGRLHQGAHGGRMWGKYEYSRLLSHIRKSRGVKGLKHRVLYYSAMTKVGYALRFAASDKEKEDYVRQACQDISDSLRRSKD